jgi:hypothetical protein
MVIHNYFERGYVIIDEEENLKEIFIGSREDAIQYCKQMNEKFNEDYHVSAGHSIPCYTGDIFDSNLEEYKDWDGTEDQLSLR